MRLLILSVLLLIVHDTFSQDLRGSLKILTYLKGCHGSCKYSYADYSKIENCGVQKDSIIEIINVFRVNGDFFFNGQLASKQKADSLDHYLRMQDSQILHLIKDVRDEKLAEFIPPRASCFGFEEYQMYMDTTVVSFIVLDGELNENGSILQQKDIEMFEKLKEILK